MQFLSQLSLTKKIFCKSVFKHLFFIKDMYFHYFSLILLWICDLGLSASIGDVKDDANCSYIIERSSWGAQEPKSSFPMNAIPSYVIIQHTATTECLTFKECSRSLRIIQDYHMSGLGWSDIGYSFLIGGDGNVYEGRGWNKEGASDSSLSKISLNIAFIGDYEENEPNQKMLDIARKLIDCGKAEGLITDLKILGFKQVIRTKSPGKKLFTKIQQWPEWMSESP